MASGRLPRRRRPGEVKFKSNLAILVPWNADIRVTASIGI